MSGQKPSWRWDVFVKVGDEWDDFRVEAPHRAAAKQEVDLEGFDVEAIHAEPVRRVTSTEIERAKSQKEAEVIADQILDGLRKVAEVFGLAT